MFSYIDDVFIFSAISPECTFLLDKRTIRLIIIIIMGIFKCYFSGEHIALSLKKKQQRCEHRIRKNQQIKSTVHVNT